MRTLNIRYFTYALKVVCTDSQINWHVGCINASNVYHNRSGHIVSSMQDITDDVISQFMDDIAINSPTEVLSADLDRTLNNTIADFIRGNGVWVNRNTFVDDWWRHSIIIINDYSYVDMHHRCGRMFGNNDSSTEVLLRNVQMPSITSVGSVLSYDNTDSLCANAIIGRREIADTLGGMLPSLSPNDRSDIKDRVRMMLRRQHFYSDDEAYDQATIPLDRITDVDYEDEQTGITQNQNHMKQTNEVDGIVYNVTGVSTRAYVHSYHRKPNPLNHFEGAKHVDITGVPTRKVPKVVHVDSNGDYKSKFTIGFEIEKNELARNAIKEYPLFCGFETDGSCGYEAVTHILPLLPQSKWRDKVFDMFDEASEIIEDAHSPSDRRCGGHITIAVDGLTGTQLMSRIRKNCGIVYALWRHRLKNQYCNKNTNMYPSSRELRYHRREAMVNGYSRYSVALVKGNCLEFRIPHRVSSVKQLKLRYELFYEIVDFTINSPRTDHAKLLERLRPLIMKMYDNNLLKTEKVMKLAEAFRHFILTKEVTEETASIFCPSGIHYSPFTHVRYNSVLVGLHSQQYEEQYNQDPEWRARFKAVFPESNLVPINS